MKKLASLIAVATLGVFVLSGCVIPIKSTRASTPPSSEATVSAPAESAPASEESFVDGVLTTKKLKIKITKYEVIPAGQPGNDYGDKPVLAIWYDTTNLGKSDKVSPTDFIFYFAAYQDNDPNRENKLEVGQLPDPAFRDTQLANIKPGGTLAHAISYELDDTTTPVDLVATEILGKEFGRMTIKIQN